MARPISMPLAATASLALCGPALLAYDIVARTGGAQTRVWNLLRGLGLGLPASDNPLLAGPILRLLNAPVWLLLSVLGVALFSALWLLRADHSE